MTDLRKAVAEYLAREKAANDDMRGCDHQLILAEVAAEYKIDAAVLAEAACDTAFARAN